MAVGTVFTSQRPRSATVLIVDDEDATRSLCHDVVTDSGLRTRTASTTEQALEILDKMPVDILITDLRVPQIGGLELLRRVRTSYPQTAVLVLTQYITKPFHIPELRSKLDRMIRLLDAVLESREGLARISRSHYDLVVCDLRMPRLDGPAFYEALIRAGSPVQDNLLFVTSDTLAPRTMRFLEKSKLPYLAKPFLVEELKLAVNRRLESSRQTEEGVLVSGSGTRQAK